jgi:hypothetical protein
LSDFTIEGLLRTAGGDGGSVPMAARPDRPESDDLYRAWEIERSHSIETEMLLTLSRAAIARLLETPESPAGLDARTTLDLIEQIDSHLRRYGPERA